MALLAFPLLGLAVSDRLKMLLWQTFTFQLPVSCTHYTPYTRYVVLNIPEKKTILWVRNNLLI